MSHATSGNTPASVSFPSKVPTQTGSAERWTKVLGERANIPAIFDPIMHKLATPSRPAALIVGGAWYLFTCAVGKFLSCAAANITDNQKRLTILPILWEEMGSGNPSDIHADMFLKSLLSVGIQLHELEHVQVRYSHLFPVARVAEIMLGAASDEEVLGACAGMEQPANENIEAIYRGVAYDDTAKQTLDIQPFFTIHRAIEDEHIGVGTSNFLRFCDDQTSRTQFLVGFDKAITFWADFWRGVGFLLP